MTDLRKRVASAIYYADGDKRADAALDVFIQTIKDRAQVLDQLGDDISADALDGFVVDLKAMSTGC